MAIHDPDATPAEKAEAVRYGRRTLTFKQGVQIATVDALGQVHGVPIDGDMDENQDGQVRWLYLLYSAKNFKFAPISSVYNFSAFPNTCQFFQ